MKKLLLLTILTALAIAIDGTLTYDLLEFRADTWDDWLGVFLALAIFVVVFFTGDTKNDKEQGNPM